MGDELAVAIASTQEQLGGLFQKPRLTEKLLSRAPFRFLHDIVFAVSASTGFAAGLYSGDELDSGAIKDKASKIAFLDKLIALVGICSGRDIPVRPSKVVSGLEPEGTNALLAALGRCAKSTELDFEEAVRRALAGERPGQRPPPVRTPTPASSTANSNGSSKGVVREEFIPGSAEAKSEDRHGEAGDGGDGGDGVWRGNEGIDRGESWDGSRGGGDSRRSCVGDEKTSAKQEMEAMGAAAKALGVPQSRRVASRAGVPRAVSKNDATGKGGLGDDPSGGNDLTAAIEACTGEISVTRQMLEPIISRPKLSDKLLNMPPFRFLHDIVSEVTRQTGFGQGLYSEQELDSSLVRAKHLKMAYLDKLIMLVGKSLNTFVDARPAKIVAGLEAENTNRLLQLLALAAVERPDSSRAVAAVLGSGDASTRRRSSIEGDSVEGGDPRTAPGDQQHPPQQKQQPERRTSSAAVEAKDNIPHEGENPVVGGQGTSDAAKGEAGDQPDVSVEHKEGHVSTSGRNGNGNAEGPDSSGAVRFRGVVNHDGPAVGGTGEAARSMRPRTARRRPPAVRDNTKDFNDGGRAQVPHESIAPPKVSNIMMEGDDDKESDDDEIGEVRIDTTGPGAGGTKGDGGHTAMVADILKEKEWAEVRAKEADAQAEADAKGRRSSEGGQDRKGTPDNGGGIRMGRLRASSMSSLAASSAAKAGVSKGISSGGAGYGDADVAKLKDAIQMLCQSTHPLGKCLDFVHADLALMSQEMERWKALRTVKAQALKAERAATETFLQPLKLQLNDVEDQLRDSTRKINGVKASISANEKRINSLLKMVVTCRKAPA